jgi:phage N-6-adenine-methyltransferase
MNNALMFSSKSDEWETPQSLFDALDDEFCFLLDAAASHDNHKGEDGTAYITAADDALSVDWLDWMKGQDGDPRSVGLQPTVWLNPPYSKCADFVAKAAAESRTGCTVVMLLPARTDTRYFHNHIWDAEHHQPKANIQVRFIKGRLKFGDAANSAPFPSMVVIFRP